jgi:hypothetical protein
MDGRRIGFATAGAAMCAALAVVVAVGATYGAEAAGLVTGKQIKNSTVTGTDIKDGSLTARDVAGGELPAGPEGPQGVQGLQGLPGTQGSQGGAGTPGTNGTSVTSSVEPPGANCPDGGSKFVSVSGNTFACDGATGPPGFDSTVIVTQAGSVPASSLGTVSVPCPAGTTVLGGGYEVAPGFETFVNVANDRPQPDGVGWLVRAQNLGGSIPLPLTVYAICA